MYRISGSKHIDGNKAWGSPFSHVQLLPTWLAHGGVGLCIGKRAAKQRKDLTGGQSLLALTDQDEAWGKWKLG